MTVLLGEWQSIGDGKRSAHGGNAARSCSKPALARARLSGLPDFTRDSCARLLGFQAMESVLLIEREGPENFDGLQRFLACDQQLSEERRLSRYMYLAERIV